MTGVSIATPVYANGGLTAHVNPYIGTKGNGHDVHGLVSLFPSEERFTEKLYSLFIVTGDLGAGASPDISGLIGQYAHGNEPSHHIAYMYHYVGKPWKGAERLREIMRTQYANQPNGLCGNEDVGQMSAWYVLSAIGL